MPIMMEATPTATSEMGFLIQAINPKASSPPKVIVQSISRMLLKLR